MPLLVEVHSGPNHWMGAYGPLLAVYWLSNIDPAVCHALHRVTKDFCAKLPSRNTAVVSISTEHTKAPSAEARTGLANLVTNTDHCIQRVAVVRESEGFVSSVVSSVVAGVQMVSQRRNSVHRFFRRVDDAVPWATSELRDFCMGQIKVADATEVLARQLVTMRSKSRMAS